jgi:FkbM family methyltransferase
MWHYIWNDKVQKLNEEGYLINDGNFAEALFAGGLFTFEVSLIYRVIEEYSDPNKDFIDIGSHIGTYSWLLSPHFNYVHAFEPNKEIYNYLCGNIALRNQSHKINTYNLGISDKEDNLTFYMRSHDGGGSGFEDIDSNEPTQDIGKLPVKTLDSFNFNNIGFIKIDVEGHEKKVLLGAKETLEKNNYPPILFESWAPGEHPEHNPQYVANLRKELFETLEGYGYIIKEWWPEIFLAVKE